LAGRELQAKVETGIPLNLTRIKLGDGTESMEAVDMLTDLVNPRCILQISTAEADNQVATITGVLASSQLSSGFYAREWGLFAMDPDVGEILYMITIDTQPEWLPPSSQTAQITATYAMNIAIANATNITVEIDPTGLVDVEMLNRVTHALQRLTAYEVGDLVNVSTLKPGLVLECAVAGTTDIALIDFGPYEWGDTVTDGTVTWVIKRYQVQSTDMFELDVNGNIMPSAEPIWSVHFELDSNGDIEPKVA
jgi:hypothetical protein